MEKSWAAVRLSSIAKIGSGRDIYDTERVAGDIPYITSGTRNNGIGYFVGNSNGVLARDVVVLNRNGAVGNAFYHPYKALVSNDCRTVNLEGEVGSDAKLFLSCAIAGQKECFSYSRKLGTARAEQLRIMLPVDGDGFPDWDYMSSFVETMRKNLLKRYKDYVDKRLSGLEYREIPNLDEVEWKKFKVFGNQGLFQIAATRSSIDGIRLIDGGSQTVPYVTRSDTNNGIARYVSKDNFSFGRDEGGCITVGLDTQTAFYQPCAFVTGQNVHVITGNALNEYVAQFLIPLLVGQMRAKFNWGGNGATLGRMKTLELMLPVNTDGEPDFFYMEQYTKNMMLRKYEGYLAYLHGQQP